MKVFRAMLVTAAVGSSFALTSPSTAQEDLMTPGRAGPIQRDETTMGDMRSWFGRPTNRKTVQVGCVRVIRAKWGDKLKVYAWRTDPRTVAAVFVRRREIHSDALGDIRIHTRRGLRVGDRERKLRRLYPGAKPITHSGHTHYRLKTARSGAYLMAKVVSNRVIQLENWPYEFC